MKKFIILLSSILLALSFTGCSCTSASQLSFSPNWKKSETAEAGFTQTTTYDVALNKAFILNESDYSTDSSVSEAFETLDIAGTYTETISVIEVNDYNKGASDVLDDSKNSTLLKITSLLSLNATYKLVGKETETYNDFVKTESYVLDTDNSIAPIYTESENNYSIVNLDLENPVQTLHFKTTTLYSKNTFNFKQQEFKYGEDSLTATPTKETSYSGSYDYKCLIDNTSLLFALRNINYTTDKSNTLPVVSPAYKSGVNLTVSYSENVKTNDANGNAIDTKIVSFVNADTNKMGRAQFVFIQNEQVAGKDNSLIVKYVSPLSEYSSSFAKLGALEYTLKTY